MSDELYHEVQGWLILALLAAGVVANVRFLLYGAKTAAQSWWRFICWRILGIKPVVHDEAAIGFVVAAFGENDLKERRALGEMSPGETVAFKAQREAYHRSILTAYIDRFVMS